MTFETTPLSMFLAIFVAVSFCAVATAGFFGWRWYSNRQLGENGTQTENYERSYVGLQGWVVTPKANSTDSTITESTTITPPADYSPNETQPLHDKLVILQNAKQIFMRLIAAWDTANTKELQLLLTVQAYHELVDEATLAPRPDAPTDILTLNAEFISSEAAKIGSIDIRFSGMYRTALSSAARRFDAIWVLEGSGADWQVSHIQPL